MLNPKRIITEAEAWAAIYFHFEIGKAAVAGRIKTQRVSLARAIWWRLMYRCTHASLPEIGRALGRHHTSPLYAIRQVETNVQKLALATQLEMWIFEQRKAVSA